MKSDKGKDAVGQEDEILRRTRQGSPRIIRFLIKSLERLDRLKPSNNSQTLVLSRNVGYGGAAICVLFILGLIQMKLDDLSLKIAIIAAAIGMPLFLFFGLLNELYICYGPWSYRHMRTQLIQRLITAVFGLAGCALFLTTASTLWYISPVASCLFVLSSFAAFILCFVLLVSLANWKHDRDGDKGDIL